MECAWYLSHQCSMLNVRYERGMPDARCRRPSSASDRHLISLEIVRRTLPIGRLLPDLRLLLQHILHRIPAAATLEPAGGEQRAAGESAAVARAMCQLDRIRRAVES